MVNSTLFIRFFLGSKNSLIRGFPVSQCKLPLPDKCLGKRYINKGVCYVLVQALQQVFMVCPHKALKFTVFSSVVLESYFKNYYMSFSPSLYCYILLQFVIPTSLLQVTKRKLFLCSKKMILPIMGCFVFLIYRCAQLISIVLQQDLRLFYLSPRHFKSKVTHFPKSRSAQKSLKVTQKSL